MDKQKALGIAAAVVAVPMLISLALAFIPGPHQDRYYHLFFVLASVVYLLLLPRNIMEVGIDEWHPHPLSTLVGLKLLIEGFKGFYWFVFSF